MQAINVAAEYRQFQAETMSKISETEFGRRMAATGKWVEDDGDYYTREEWDAQYDEYPEEPDTDCHCGHPECGAC